ncbi:MAG: hypothetical protein IKC77_04795 [Lentisphaeria bacterium]|nr:hypothetical protein [Lentisphaeria bacterium]
MQKINVACRTSSLDEYRRLAALAKEFGATHLQVNQIEPSMWMWDINRYDPYPNWGLENPTLFKFIVPKELEKHFDTEYAKRNLEMLKARAEILKEFGLKATFGGMEPAYMPESVYREHPEWRGARCDQTRRARTEYFAPCLDNEELRAIYVRTVAELCQAAPIESFTLLTNDSGGGLCWAEGLYPGKNGPLACSHIPMGKRIARYLSIFQEGAALAGLKAEAGVFHIAESDMIASLPDLLEGQSINNRTATSSTARRHVGFSVPYGDHTTPVKLMPRLIAYAEHMQNIQGDQTSSITYSFRSIEDIDAIEFVKKYNGKIGAGPAGIYQALTDFAVSKVGEELAADLVTVWDLIEKTVRAFDYLETGGHIFYLGSVHQRWLTRPLVAFPGEPQTRREGLLSSVSIPGSIRGRCRQYVRFAGKLLALRLRCSEPFGKDHPPKSAHAEQGYRNNRNAHRKNRWKRVQSGAQKTAEERALLPLRYPKCAKCGVVPEHSRPYRLQCNSERHLSCHRGAGRHQVCQSQSAHAKRS